MLRLKKGTPSAARKEYESHNLGIGKERDQWSLQVVTWGP
jgi:hypothetical protein